MALDDYRLMGRSGLRVSPMALGGMTFGRPWTGTWSSKDPGWGMERGEAEACLGAYVDAGGNFLDTSDHYGSGASEQIIGAYVSANRLRDRMVICTKAGFVGEHGNPNAAGSGRKNLLRSIDGSLRRLQTDYVDLFLLHVWDGITPVEEIVRTLDELVRSGKARYVGLSNVPVSFAARFQTLAHVTRLEQAYAMQFDYSLVERNIELEHVDLCRDFGTGLMAYGALASGFLTGKYERESEGASGEGRLSKSKRMFRSEDRKWAILDTLREVSGELGRSPAEVALSWVCSRPQVASVVIGVSGTRQVAANLAALDLVIPPNLLEQLDAASKPEARYPVRFLRDNAPIFLGARVSKLG